MAEWKRAGSFKGKGGARGGFKGGRGGEFVRGSFGKPRFGGGFKKPFKKDFGEARDGGERKMFDAVCTSCGADCQVPFKPNGKTPVLCKSCFAKERGEEGGERRDRGERRSFDRDDRREKPRFDTRTSFKDGRPERREFSASTPDPRIDSILGEMKSMNATLTKLVTLMSESAEKDAVSLVTSPLKAKKETSTKVAPKKAATKAKAKKA